LIVHYTAIGDGADLLHNLESKLRSTAIDERIEQANAVGRHFDVFTLETSFHLLHTFEGAERGVQKRAVMSMPKGKYGKYEMHMNIRPHISGPSSESVANRLVAN